MRALNSEQTSQDYRTESGSILVSILIIIVFLTTLIFSLMVLANANMTRARDRILLLQAQYSAESGSDAAIAEFNYGDVSYAGSGAEVEILSNSLYRTTYETEVVDGSDEREKIVTSVGRVYTPAAAITPSFTRTIEVTVQRSSTTSASGILSRNIIDIQSGVKSIKATDIYVNGYIHMNRNTTDLIAENIIVAGRNTGAGNCSIGGSGNLEKPASFSDPTQTKTNIIVAYNNCISPPGNASNADFDVTANAADITEVQSTFIPWSQYMDSSYGNSPGGCSDWTSGSSPRNIPSTGNAKRTHYPDDSSNISSSCGTSGNIQLSGQYNILDHVHIRANLCSSSACTPTFNNPDPGDEDIKFVFIEGTINFDRLTTAAGSGPIVFVTYGADPASKNSVCPHGGSLFLGNNGDTNAPAAYLIAMNGLCLDRTRFGADPALGGVSGKNIYVATNPGTPFDLGLNPGFPVESIPVDLAWRAVRYQRL